jgi:hypothetical protein
MNIKLLAFQNLKILSRQLSPSEPIRFARRDKSIHVSGHYAGPPHMLMRLLKVAALDLESWEVIERVLRCHIFGFVGSNS